MKKNNRFYVYFLIDSRNNKPFYIGKGTKSRDASHLCEAKKHPSQWSNIIKCLRINSILDDGGNIIIEKVHDNISEDEAYLLEAGYIKQYGQIVKNTGILTNIITEDRVHPRAYKKVDQYSLDGEYIRTFESVQLAAKEVGVDEKSLSRGICNHKSKRQTVSGYRWVHHGKKLSHYNRYEAIYEKKMKKVCQYNFSGEYIRTFDSAKQASELVGVSQQKLSLVCNHKRVTTAGFCWAFENEIPRMPNLNDKRYKVNI